MVSKNIENHGACADAGVNETAEMTKEKMNSTEKGSFISSSPPTLIRFVKR